MTVVLDSSAILAVIRGEPGRDRVLEAVQDATMSTVNFAEVVSKPVERGSTERDVERITDPFALSLRPFDAAPARESGLLRTAAMENVLPLGDPACLAPGLALEAPVLTADRAWAGLDVGVAVEVIR